MCELCDANRLTAWYYEDDECWIAECELCSVPMVVWRQHDANPDDIVKSRLWGRLAIVVTEHYGFDHYIDDNMRSIPDHYHAHARPREGFFGRGRIRRN
jgi:hypothetical protein